MIVMYSGGMDSAIALLRYRKQIKLALAFNYGSKHNNREFEKASGLCYALGIPIQRIDLRKPFQLFKSDLLKSGGDVPDGHYEDKSMKRTVVPFRNGIMLAIAAGIAESIGEKEILIGNHAGDRAIYPDCRIEFTKAMASAIKIGTDKKIKLKNPFVKMTKRQIARLGRRLGMDWSQTYSCYKGGKVHCGTCGTCTERIEALAGFDPTHYVTPPLAETIAKFSKRKK